MAKNYRLTTFIYKASQCSDAADFTQNIDECKSIMSDYISRNLNPPASIVKRRISLEKAFAKYNAKNNLN